MNAATHDDITRLYPGIQDHAVVEILAMGANVEELEAAMAFLSSDDEALIDVQHRAGDRINRLLGILRQSDVEALQDRDR